MNSTQKPVLSEYDQEIIDKLRSHHNISGEILEQFIRPYEDMARSKLYSDQQMAFAFMSFAYYMLRRHRSADVSSGLFRLFGRFITEHSETEIKKSGTVDHFN